MNCRNCRTPLREVFLDLGSAPPSNAYLTEAALRTPETAFPLRLFVCHNCFLVQTEDYAGAEALFTPDYAYFSSVSSSWCAHAARYAAMIRELLGLGPDSLVVEAASNDGYLLRHFLEAGVPCLGVEPTAGTAEAAEKLGIPVLREFFGEALGRRLAAEGRKADLVVGNNVYAHVPDIHDFTAGIREALASEGVVTLEFPHLLRLIEHVQFDTVYHEHFSYLSLSVVREVFAAHGLRVWRVEELATHGGSLRVYGCHAGAARPEDPSVLRTLAAEATFGLGRLETYRGFQERANRVKNDLCAFLVRQKRQGRRVAAYGAAAKGNTLLNYAGIRPDLVPYVCDAAPSKQGHYLPGSRIPVVKPDRLRCDKPDVVLVLPWNILGEIMAQHAYVRDWGGRFVTAVPRLDTR
ncbi:class I SAM-dependent methyltransferase [Solidesulfovibrio sp.]|uniref:class I SAM-dependent methyltransferase n=1 Tax=Solidesulfovibrio sp. TaxID=2910990 RepID=UPI00260351C3|nr:class I SAM-dependent methyltransferase [Solidesulfovibrio sp.]